MPSFGMAEVFGIRTGDVSPEAWGRRATAECPFTSGKCIKAPSGVCSIEDGRQVAITCPHRFREGGLIYRLAAESIFGAGSEFRVLGEIPFLRSATGSGSVGNIDNVVVHLADGRAVSWCALEVQAVYFSGREMGTESRTYFETSLPVVPGPRRPDYRSSSAKRLLPQLEVKVPVLSRWGKKMVVVVDRPFFEALPPIREANDLSNADICWVIYRLDPINASRYELVHDRTVLSTLASTREALVGGFAPPKPEFEATLTRRLKELFGLEARF